MTKESTLKLKGNWDDKKMSPRDKNPFEKEEKGNKKKK